MASKEDIYHPDGQLYKAHWKAALDTIIVERAKNAAAAETITQWSARALLAEAALEKCLLDSKPAPDCDREFGGNGELWKPHSESTGTVVILMPIQYEDATVRVTSGGEEVATVIRESLRGGSDSKHPGQHPNGNRKHWWLSKKCGELELQKPIVVEFIKSDGSKECRVVPDPCQRYD